MFVKSFDLLDHNNVGLLLETNEGLMVDWVVVKGVCSRIDKRRDWRGEGSLEVGPTAETRGELVLTSIEETRRWLESGQARTNVIVGPSGGAALEELTKMVRDLQITQDRKDDGSQPRDERLPVNQRCLWCDVVGHAQRDCADFGEALKNDVVYLWNDA